MPDRIRFTLVSDGGKERHFDFDTEKVQIGCDPTRGDNLKIDLPAGLTHVRARVNRSGEYVEFEVKGGPIWLQGTRLDEGDVAELNIGDVLIFGRKDGPKLRYEQAKEADIVMDDVADWSAAAAPKKKKKTAEDDLMFEEEVDEYAGLNIWQKYLKWFRKQYAKFAVWRKKAARIKYWIGVGQLIYKRTKGYIGMGLMFARLATTYYTQYKAKLDALLKKDQAVEQAKLAVQAEKQQQQIVREVQEKMVQCGCDDAAPVNQGALATADAVLNRFDDPTLNVERLYPLPNKTQASYSTLMAADYNGFAKDRSLLPATLDRLCSATGDKERMNLVVVEANKWGLHEAYTFLPFVESYWCELAISPTGPRGMMQFTRDTAIEAFRKVDSSQSNIPPFDFEGHRKWLTSYATSKGMRGYNDLLAKCPATARQDYQKQFFGGQGNPEYPKRIDPRDPRTDWEWSTKAAMAWLAALHSNYSGRGWRDFDAMLLAMSAYNQGEGLVQRWIVAAKQGYNVEQESSLEFPQIIGGAYAVLEQEQDPVIRGRIQEGMKYGPKIMGAYLAAAPVLDERQCRN